MSLYIEFCKALQVLWNHPCIWIQQWAPLKLVMQGIQALDWIAKHQRGGAPRGAPTTSKEKMQGARSDDVNKGSPLGMEMGSDHSAKKPRLEQLPSGPLNQEIVVHEPARGGVAAVAAEDVPTKRAEVSMKIDVTVLQCPLCLRSLKPPVFQCKGGHLACAGCLDGACVKCGAAFDVPNTAMDAVVAVARMQCPHDGCETYVPYHEVQEHQSVCPHAPCHCTEPGCGFAGATPELVAHLAAAHAMPVHKVPRFKATRIQATVPEPARRLLVCAEDEGGAFLLTLGALGAATVVSAVCVRPAGCEWPRYKVKMWSSSGPAPVAHAADRRMDIVLADFEATSSATPGAITFDKLTSYLIVPPGYLVGDGPSKELPLQIRIEKTDHLLIV